MNINTARFGEIPVDESKVITMAGPIKGESGRMFSSGPKPRKSPASWVSGIYSPVRSVRAAQREEG